MQMTGDSVPIRENFARNSRERSELAHLWHPLLPLREKPARGRGHYAMIMSRSSDWRDEDAIVEAET
jgi:hypothetical protein